MNIKTHRNQDGTYDASIDGKRLGLTSIFRFSARSVALTRIARKEAELRTMLLVERMDCNESTWQEVSPLEFIADKKAAERGEKILGWNTRIERKENVFYFRETKWFGWIRRYRVTAI